jgi:sulfur-oxidizing protein SoxX
MHKKTTLLLAAGIAAVAVVGCATQPRGADADKLAQEMMRTSCRNQGIATTDRITNIDETLKLCNAADVAGKPLAPEVAKRI